MGQTKVVDDGPERRIAPRLPVCWSGLVLSGPQALACMVRDLSPTGANLGHIGPLRSDQVIGLHVRHGRGEVTLPARVMWVDERSHSAGVAFLGGSSETSERLRDALSLAVTRLRAGGTGRVLVVGLSAEEAMDVRQAARACGFGATCVATPLDAITTLLAEPAPVAVVVAPSLAGTPGREFVDLVEREHPKVARLLVCDGRPTPVWGHEDRTPKVYRPWDAADLGDALDAAVHQI